MENLKQNPPPRRALRDSGKQRRLAIIQAVLRVIARDGLRAVSHRAVAAEAKVPLAATTYYFRDLQELITESFRYWSREQRVPVEALHRRAIDLLGDTQTPRDKEALVAALAEMAADYVLDHVHSHPQDRVLERAFEHEATRVPEVRAAVRDQHLELLQLLQRFHVALGSDRPGEDAQISHSVILGVERYTMLMDFDHVDKEGIRAVLLRYLRSIVPTGRRRSAAVA